MRTARHSLAAATVLAAALCPSSRAEPPPAPRAAVPDLAPACAEIEKIRGLAFKKPVAGEAQTEAEFRKRAPEIMDQQMPAEFVENRARAAAAWGFLPPGTDLKALSVELAAMVILAYYDPEREKFYVVKDPAKVPAIMTRILCWHELTHALQDQHFDLDAFLLSQILKISSDEIMARRSLVEGEATYVALLAQLGMAGKGNPAALNALIDRQFAESIASEPADLVVPLPEDFARVMGTLQKTPRVLLAEAVEPYNAGGRFVHEVFKARGWDGVTAAFRDPPRSYEQVLHPEKYLAQPDPPTKVALPDLAPLLGPSWKKFDEDVLGELLTRILAEGDLSAPRAPERKEGDLDPRKAAEGWDGDRYDAYAAAPKGPAAIAWVSAWDSEEEVGEFWPLLLRTMKQRFPTEAAKADDAFEFRAGPQAGAEGAAGRRKGKNLFLVFGAIPANPAPLLDTLEKETRFQEP